VKIGVRRDARVEIVEGLTAGDQVVTAGMRLSRDGQPVKIIDRPTPAEAQKKQAAGT